MRAAILTACLTVLAGSTHAGGWTLYGEAGKGKAAVTLLYDPQSVKRTPRGTLTASTELLSQWEIDAWYALPKNRREILKVVKKRLQEGPTLPFAQTLHHVDPMAYLGLLTLEEEANGAPVLPVALATLEVDCTGSRVRRLSMQVTLGDYRSTDQEATEWVPVEDQSNEYRLALLTCSSAR